MADVNYSVKHGPIGVVLTIENGEVIHSRPVQKGEITASLETFLWMAERDGYTVIPPAGGKDNDPDSDTHP